MTAIDPSELLPIVAASLVAVFAVAAFFRVRRVAAKALRLALTCLTGLISLAAVLVAGASIFFYVNYTRHLGPLGSPDRRHVAITTYTVNDGTGVDQVEVAIRHVWSPYAYRVYAGLAQYRANPAAPEPELRWIDDNHLEIAFHSYMTEDGAGRSSHAAGQGCANSADGITIRCVENRVHAVK